MVPEDPFIACVCLLALLVWVRDRINAIKTTQANCRHEWGEVGSYEGHRYRHCRQCRLQQDLPKEDPE